MPRSPDRLTQPPARKDLAEGSRCPRSRMPRHAATPAPSPRTPLHVSCTPCATPFQTALREATEPDNEHLDEVLSAGNKPTIGNVPLTLRNRELSTAAEVEELLDEVRKCLMERINACERVRLT